MQFVYESANYFMQEMYNDIKLSVFLSLQMQQQRCQEQQQQQQQHDQPSAHCPMKD